MRTKSFIEADEKYDSEIDRIVKTIKKEKAKNVLLQFPEGMKPYSTFIADKIEGLTNCECFLWMGSCFGACDIPLDVERLGIDLIIQFGHSDWKYNKRDIKVL
jgi:2-(3-amino-3-carboxypropyl)histidine synthase